MNNQERRNLILKILNDSTTPISASVLAKKCDCSRQIIVSDIALLRAGGIQITSERRGYVLFDPAQGGILETIICRHTPKDTLKEFYAIVDNGGKMQNVIVEHPIYGQICADLNITSRFDAEEFMRKSKESGASQLCALTDGIHIHTIIVPDEKSYERILRTLKDERILYEE